MALALLALPAVASAAPKQRPKVATESYVNEPEPPHARISVRGANGYEIRISISERTAGVFARRDADSDAEPETSVDYDLFHARATSRRVHANLGPIGLVSARFVPSGKVERFKSPGCKGGPEVTRYGAFVGTIRIEGEEGFTRFSARRVRGTISSAPRQFCRRTKARVVEEPSPDPGPRHFLTSFFASAVTDDAATFFSVTERELEPQVARVQASRFENRPNMLITREVTIDEAPSTGFAFDAGLDHATVAPPAPFAGTATFTRIDDFASRWEGPLTVSFAGGANVPLTGREFAWSLDRSTDPDDFVEGMFP